MEKKVECMKCPFSIPKRDRSIITKVGHIKREINTSNRLSDKSIERLKKILCAYSEDSCFSGPKDNFDNIFASIEKYRNFDHLNDEQKFWVYELMEWTRYGMIEINQETF